MSKPVPVPFAINWPLLPTPDDQGRLNFPDPEKSITQQLRIILSTRPGENRSHPQFGAGLEDFVHQPNILATRRSIQDRVTRALAQWENRIEVFHVEVAEVPDRPTFVRVEILYRIHRSGATRRMGLTLKLE